jgi:quinol monooxygenase YgiN
MSQLLTVVARLRARPGRETELRHQLQRLVNPTRAEAGCITYELNESKSEPGLFLFYEVWKSDLDLDEHFQTPHMLVIGKILPELLAEPMDLSKWRGL